MQVLVRMSGSSFTNKTGIPWSAGFLPSRDKERYNLRQENGRWHFVVDGVQYSAKRVSPQLTEVQTFREY
jgi:hypothetical protein